MVRACARFVAFHVFSFQRQVGLVWLVRRALRTAGALVR